MLGKKIAFCSIPSASAPNKNFAIFFPCGTKVAFIQGKSQLTVSM